MCKVYPRRLTPLIMTIAVTFVGGSVARAQRAADFGNQWVRAHPFTVMGLQQTDTSLKIDKYKAANMSSMLVWWNNGNGKPIAQVASDNNVPWHAYIVDGEGEESARIADYASVGKSIGWMVGDEIPRQQMTLFGSIANTAKQQRPNDLVYTNMLPTYATAGQLYGGTPPAGGYSYSQYVDDVVQIIKPDVLMYDFYPF